MGINFNIEYHEDVAKEDIPRLSSEQKERVQKSIEEKLSTQPDLFGKPLRRSLRGYWKLRVGDYRIIFRINRKIVKIILIQHRSVVYKIINKRKITT